MVTRAPRLLFGPAHPIPHFRTFMTEFTSTRAALKTLVVRIGSVLATLMLLGASAVCFARSEGRPWEESTLSLEHGLLWQVGKSTPLSYRLIPTQFSWRSREAFG